MFPLISTADLAVRLHQPDVKIIDGSWHLDGRDAQADFAAGHIPGAAFFDLDAASDHSSPLPHMLPSPASFAATAGALGIRADDHIVVYDTAGLFSAARVRWMFRVMGAARVQVLDGGLPLWRAEGRPIDLGEVQTSAADFAANLQPDAVAAVEDVRTALTGAAQVLDARGAPRFHGEVAEPRPGLRSGHMPGALNLPFARLIDSDGRLKRDASLEQAFQDAGVDLDRPVITTCGSGVTAAILSLGLEVLGRPSRLYDGSWAEWGALADAPVETG